MEMKRYVKHSPAWWVITAVMLLAALVCTVLAISFHVHQKNAQPEPLSEATELYDGGYYSLDVQYITDWVYRLDYDDGTSDVFYLAEDGDFYCYVLQMDEEQYLRFAAIADYTASEDCDLYENVTDNFINVSEEETEQPPEEVPAVVKPAPAHVSGILRSLPDNIITPLAKWADVSEEEFLNYYGAFYIDLNMLPTDVDNDMTAFAILAGLYTVIFGAAAVSYSVQFRKMRKKLEAAGLYDRAESEFHYLQGDPKAEVLVSTAFVYGRRSNVVLPLADVEWVYRTEEKVLWEKQTSVTLLTNEGRAYNLRMHRKTTRRTADAIVNAVAARNPDVLVGLTRENQRLYSHDVPNAKQIVIRPWLGFFIGITVYFIVRLVLNLLLD